MCIVGSIDVEQRIEPIKHATLTSKQNYIKDPKAIALFRASKNLKHTVKAKEVIGKIIIDYL